MKLLIVNGPSLNLLGRREPEIYGHTTMEDCLQRLRERFPEVEIDYFQSNHEGDIIDRLQSAGFGETDGIILNPGAYGHTSLAIADTIRAIATPVVEVHLSNIAAREEIRHTTLTGAACRGIIAGFGTESYALGILSFLSR